MEFVFWLFSVADLIEEFGGRLKELNGQLLRCRKDDWESPDIRLIFLITHNRGS